VNPFTQRCGLHLKAVEATDVCDDFEKARHHAESSRAKSSTGKKVLLILGALLFVQLCCGEDGTVLTFEYGEVKQLVGKDISGVTLRAKDFAAYYGFQFGPGADDVFYLIFDCAREYERHDIMWIYIPGHDRYGQPVLMKGSWKSGRIVFKKFKMAGTFGDTDILYDIQLSDRTLWGKRKIDLASVITCRIENQGTDKKCRFLLQGSFLPVMQAFAPITVVQVLQEPTMKVSWDHRTSPPHVKCRIVMGKQGLVPVRGLKARAGLVVTDGKGNVKIKTRIKVNPRGVRAYFSYKPRRKLKQATPYKAKITLDLTPFFGVLKGSATTVLRK